MNNFNFNRFCQTLRWMTVNDFRSMMAWMVGYAACIFLGEMFFLSMRTYDDYSYYEYLKHRASDFPTGFIMIAILVHLSLIFFDYRKKAKREALMMLPATNLEKFLSAMFYVTVVWTLVVFIAFIVGDTMRMVACAMMYGNEWISTLPMVLERLTPDGFHISTNEPTYFMVAKIFCTVSLITWIHSLYVFCGTLLRKYAFVVATMTLILSIAFTLWAGYDKLHLNMFYGTTHGDGVLVYEVGALGYLLCVLLPMLAVFNYWASFQIFKGFQLITNKWTNYDILKR